MIENPENSSVNIPSRGGIKRAEWILNGTLLVELCGNDDLEYNGLSAVFELSPSSNSSQNQCSWVLNLKQ